jgi:hypothetical protein
MPCPAWLTRGFAIAGIERQGVWDLGNQALYDLCRKHPDHRSVDAIIAKVWLIGRTYAASIERRRQHTSAEGDDFYVDVVGPAIKSSGIDRWLAPLWALRRPDPAAVIPVHKRLTDLFEEISGLEKRSLASKYLHFHVPQAAYIYDARAVAAIRQVSPPLRRLAISFDESDEEYARYFLRCEGFRQELERVVGRAMTPREVDNVLLAVAGRR